MGSFTVKPCLHKTLLGSCAQAAHAQLAQSTLMHARIAHVGIREVYHLADKAYTGQTLPLPIQYIQSLLLHN